MAAKKRKVEIKSKKTVFKGRYKIDEYVFDFDRAAGKGRLTDVKRLVFERGDSAAALIHDVERDVIVLAEQFRIATYDKGPGYIVEAMAGSVEEDEEPEDCIRREMMEEVGYRAGKLTLVSQWLCLAGVELGADLSLLCAGDDGGPGRSESVRAGGGEGRHEAGGVLARGFSRSRGCGVL